MVGHEIVKIFKMFIIVQIMLQDNITNAFQQYTNIFSVITIKYDKSIISLVDRYVGIFLFYLKEGATFLRFLFLPIFMFLSAYNEVIRRLF